MLVERLKVILLLLLNTRDLFSDLFDVGAKYRTLQTCFRSHQDLHSDIDLVDDGRP